MALLVERTCHQPQGPGFQHPVPTCGGVRSFRRSQAALQALPPPLSFCLSHQRTSVCTLQALPRETGHSVQREPGSAAALTSLQALHGALAARVGGPDLFAHLLDDRQQVRVSALGSLRAGWLHGLGHGAAGKRGSGPGERGVGSSGLPAAGALGSAYLHVAHGGRPEVVEQRPERGSGSRHRARRRRDTSGCGASAHGGGEPNR